VLVCCRSMGSPARGDSDARLVVYPWDVLMYYEIESRHSLEVVWIIPFAHTITLNWCVTYGHM